MALTESTMLSLGSAAPEFALPEVISGNIIRLDDFRGTVDALVVMFICAHCPYVKHVEQGLAAFGKDYLDKPVGIVAISSNDAIAHRDDSPEYLRRQSENCGFTFDYLYDETQDVRRRMRPRVRRTSSSSMTKCASFIAASSTQAAPAPTFQ
jgi:peroxiredoxin